MPTLEPKEESENQSATSVTSTSVSKSSTTKDTEQEGIKEAAGSSSTVGERDEPIVSESKVEADAENGQHDKDQDIKDVGNVGNGSQTYADVNMSFEEGAPFSSFSEFQSLGSQSQPSSEWVTVPGEADSTEYGSFEKPFENQNVTETILQDSSLLNETLEEVTSISEESLTASHLNEEAGKKDLNSEEKAELAKNLNEGEGDVGEKGDLISSDVKEEEESEWLDVLGSGDLMKRVLKPGQGKDSRPDRSQVVTVNLSGRLDDGRIVECCEGLQFTVGDAEVIQGFDLVLPLMEMGETAEIVVKPRFAYGKLGKGPEIPSEATITYTVELLNVEEEPEIDQLTLEERLNLGNRRREKGNFWFGRGEYAQSVLCYRRALDYLDDENQNFTAPAHELQDLLETRLKVYNNIAAAQLKLEALDAAMKSIESVLRVQPDNVKALFRKGKILAAQGNLNEAINFMKKALNLEPDTKVIHQELTRLMEKKKTQTKSERDMYRRMMGLPQENPTKKKNHSSYTMWGTILGGIAAVLVGIIVYRQYHGSWN